MGIGNHIERDSNADIQLAVFPNPTQGYLQISSSSPIIGIRIFDSLGKIVKTENSKSELNKSISIDNLPSGVYVVAVKTIGGVAFKNIIKF